MSLRLFAASALTACLAAAACSSPAERFRLPDPTLAPREPATFPEGWRFKAGETATFTEHAMAVSNSPLASEAAAEILRAGGNAVDAAVALGFALAVTWPEAGNIGGGGYMVIRLADGTQTAVDYREVAPAAATRDMYLDENGTLTDRSVIGHLAVGVPGAVAGLLAALERHGTMSRETVMAPAIRYAREGIVIDSGLARSLAGSATLIARFEGRTTFLPGDSAPQVGARLVQPDLARTLEAIAAQGRDGFYKGWVADSFVAEMQRGGGIITHEDLAAYEPVFRTPIVSTYRGFTLLSMPPSSSGGVTMAEAHNVFETWDASPAQGSTDWYHRQGAVFQRAFIDRNAKIGDPAFVDVPLEELTSKDYARALRGTIREDTVTPTATVDSAMREIAEGVHTTHYSVVDAMGNAVATTTTLNNSWGSGVFVRGAGFMLNDEMDDFAAQPGMPNMFGLVQGEQNAIAPGKRMLSAMSPTIVLDSARNVLMVVGAAGGPTIITGTSEVIRNVLDHRMSLADAMRAPRTHHQGLPDRLDVERGGVAPAVRDSLEQRGWTLFERAALVNVNAILRVNGGWEGVPEPRRWGAAAGY